MSHSTVVINEVVLNHTITVDEVTEEILVDMQEIGGPPGASAYDVAVANGFVGTVEEWLDSLEGSDASVTNANVNAALADNATASRTALGLGSAALANTTDFATSAQGTDERVPTAAGLTSKFSTAKATPVDNDRVAIFDSAASNAPKHTLWSSVKSTLKSYFDTVYAAIVHTHVSADITDASPNTQENGGKILKSTPEGRLGSISIEGEYSSYVQVAVAGKAGAAGLSSFGSRPDGTTVAELYLQRSNTAEVSIRVDNLTGVREIQIPNASGTLALTSDITNSVTSATTSDGTAVLSVAEVVATASGNRIVGIYASDEEGRSGSLQFSDGVNSVGIIMAENSPTADLVLPSSSGTIALTSDIPTDVNNITSATTSDGTASLSIASLQTSNISVIPNGGISLISTNSGGFVRLNGQSATDARNIAFPDASGTVALTSQTVLKSDYTPSHSILAQQSGTGSPTAVTLGNNTILGRMSGGGSNIAGLSASDARTVMGLGTLATVNGGTGVATALAVNVGTAGAFVVNGGTATNMTLAGTTAESPHSIGNSGTSQTLSLANGTFQSVTMTGNCTFTMPTATAGRSFTLRVNTGAGGFTGTFTGVKWQGSVAPTLTSTASRLDIIAFVADGANWYGVITQNFTP